MTDQTEDNVMPQSNQRSAALSIGLPAVGLGLVVAALIWGFQSADAAGTRANSSTHCGSFRATTGTPSVEQVAEPATTDALAPEPEVTEAPALTVDALNALLPATSSGWGIEPLGTTFVQQANAIERGMAMIDNLRQGEVPYKLLPVARPKQAFSVISDGSANTVNTASFSRYNGLVRTLEGVNTAAMVAFYRQHETTFAAAWAALGYSNVTLEQAILASLESILLTPEIPLDARLIKKEANWIYEDKKHRSTPGVAKASASHGPENMQVMQNLARELRGAILDSAG